MFTIAACLLVFIVWFGSVVVILRVDASRIRRAKKRRGEVDFMDRSVTPYMLTALFSGALPLIVYFGTTRRNATGWLLGVAVCVLDFVGVALVGAVLLYGANLLDHRSEHRHNLEKYARARAACATPLDPRHAADDPCLADLKDVYFMRGYDNDDDAKLEMEANIEACNNDRAWACDWLRENAIGRNVSEATLSAWADKEEKICRTNPGVDPVCTKNAGM
jgi:hypothetical protein